MDARNPVPAVRHRLLAAGIAAVCAALANAAAKPHVPSNTDVVQNCNDSGSGSLRDVIASAGSGDTIDLTGLACSTISLTTGTITITQNTLTLLGPGPSLTIDGARVPGKGVLYDTGGGGLQVHDLTIANGYNTESAIDARGGCIHSESGVSLIDVVVSGCSAYASGGHAALGGGIWAAAQVYLVHSAVTGNSAIAAGVGRASGGGVYASNAMTCLYNTIADNTTSNGATGTEGAATAGGVYVKGPVLINWSTISGNTSGVAGGIELVDPSNRQASIISSTISGNSAFAIGGVYSQTILAVYNSTIAFNSATTASDGTNPDAFAAGVQIVATNGAVQSSIVANNVADDAGELDLGGTLSVVTGHNDLIMQSAIGVPDDTIHDDPELGALEDNGGPTKTRRPSAPSVIGAGSNVLNLGFDQRGIGFPRVFGYGGVDIGAIETDDIFLNGFD